MTDAGVIGILLAHLRAFSSGELKTQSVVKSFNFFYPQAFLKQEGPWALDRSLEFLSQGEDQSLWNVAAQAVLTGWFTCGQTRIAWSQDRLSGLKFTSKSGSFGEYIHWETPHFNWPIKKQYWKTVYQQLIYYLLPCHVYCVCNAGTSTSVIGIRHLNRCQKKNLFGFRQLPFVCHDKIRWWCKPLRKSCLCANIWWICCEYSANRIVHSNCLLNIHFLLRIPSEQSWSDKKVIIEYLQLVI